MLAGSCVHQQLRLPEAHLLEPQHRMLLWHGMLSSHTQCSTFRVCCCVGRSSGRQSLAAVHPVSLTSFNPHTAGPVHLNTSTLNSMVCVVADSCPHRWNAYGLSAGGFCCDKTTDGNTCSGFVCAYDSNANPQGNRKCFNIIKKCPVNYAPYGFYAGR
jgi:hypothetical protein